MPKKHYLLKVLGLSGIPKIATFILTLASFPLLLRNLGANDYGVVLFIGSALSLFEVLVDFGVSSAAGKSMAAVRAHHPQTIRSEFLAWARLQSLFVCIGFAPMLLAAYLIVKDSPSFRAPSLLLVMAAAVGFNVVLNFVRPNLQSLLAFKSLAALDTFESVVRSTGYFVVAFVYPSALGLAFAGLATSVTASALAMLLVARRLSAARADYASLAPDQPNDWPGKHYTVKSRIRTSANFLWLRFSTRLFQEGPILIIGRLLGAEVVGIIGAFRKVSEILSIPYLVIGNALMVRVNEVASQGSASLQALWDTALRIVSTVLFIAALVYLAAEPLAQVLLPGSKNAPVMFAVMSLLVAVTATFGTLAPMSDYMGGLSSRNVLLTVTALVQLPILWVAGITGSIGGAVVAYVAVNLILALGYACITHKVFFRTFVPKVRREVLIFASVIATALIGSVGLLDIAVGGGAVDPFAKELLLALNILLFNALVATALLLNKNTRLFYFNKNFFEFTLTFPSGHK